MELGYASFIGTGIVRWKMADSDYIDKWLKKLKQANKSSRPLRQKRIINRIYEDGFEDGYGEGKADGEGRMM